MLSRVLALLTLALPAPALAETHEVRMFNRSAAGPMVHEPRFPRMAHGDTVRFTPAQPSRNAAPSRARSRRGPRPFAAGSTRRSRSR